MEKTKESLIEEQKPSAEEIEKVKEFLSGPEFKKLLAYNLLQHRSAVQNPFQKIINLSEKIDSVIEKLDKMFQMLETIEKSI
jgi:hypothetical protein